MGWSTYVRAINDLLYYYYYYYSFFFFRVMPRIRVLTVGIGRWIGMGCFSCYCYSLIFGTPSGQGLPLSFIPLSKNKSLNEAFHMHLAQFKHTFNIKKVLLSTGNNVRGQCA